MAKLPGHAPLNQTIKEKAQEQVNLDAIINVEDIQSIMEDFSRLTNMTTAILDLNGKVIEATGWQDICANFHRQNPTTMKFCTESDLFLSNKVNPGEYIDYKCKNGLWDVITPLYVENKHLGNIYTGQFFYTDEEIDEDFFLRHAQAHGFDQQAYMAALRRVPKYSRKTIRNLMGFLTKLTTYISRIGFVNLKLEAEIRERKQAETALKESETYLRTLLQTIPDLIWLKERDGGYLFCNPRFEQFFGAKENEIIGKTDYDFVDKELADFFRMHDKLAMVKGEPSTNEEEVTFACDGHREMLETIKTPMFDSEGQLIGVLGIGRNISERKRAEKEKEKIEEQYRQSQKVEAIGRLAGGVAHDLNNLLTPILGYGDLMLNDFGPGDVRRKRMEQIVQAGSRARDLVHQLLAFSRKQTLEYRPIDLNRAVTGFEKLMRSTIREDVEIKTILGNDIQTVMADIGQMEQVMMNLVVNAADAMPEGGQLTLETGVTEVTETDAISHQEMKPGTYALLTISDNGFGMDADTLEHLFEPFYSTKGEQGTGLGLATVHGIVKQHRGNISVQSIPGAGTTFKIFLPVYTGTQEADKKTVKPDVDLQGHETILLVEDNAQVRDFGRIVLTQQGYTVLTAKSGADALSILKSQKMPVHLLVTDVIMPGMNGIELYSKANQIIPELKVLYMSGYTDDLIAHRGVLDQGVNFIHKPFTVHGLTAKIREALS